MAIYFGNEMVGLFGVADQVNGSFSQLDTLSVTANGTYTPSSGHAYSSVSVNVLPTLKSGVLRSDAELIQTYSNDSLVVKNDGKTIPAWTTSSSTLVSSVSFSPTIAISLDTYDYYVLERFLTIPIYNTTTIGAGRVEYQISAHLYEILNLPANTFKARINNTYHTSATRQFPVLSLARMPYWTSATALGLYTSAAYGTYQSVSAPTATATALTVKAPSLSIRGNTTYFTQTYFEATTDIRRQYIIEVYRAPKSHLNLDGWGLGQEFFKTLQCAHSTSGKLV